VATACATDYGDQFRKVWGNEICEPKNVSKAYNAIGLTVAAYTAENMGKYKIL
jgi:hypothetical protein